MAISFKGQPPKIHPGYNPIFYYVDSTNKNNASFRYVFQIYDAGTSTELCSPLKVAPRPVDGYGYADISKLIQNKLDGYFNLTGTTFSNADNSSVYNYDIKFGEEYISQWSFTDYIFDNSFSGGQVALTGTTSHGYVIGDQVVIKLNNVYNDFRDTSLNGYFSVIGIVSSTKFVINLNWPGSAPATPGKTNYADNRKTTFSGLTSSLSRVAFNAGYDLVSFKDYNTTAYTGTSSIQLYNSGSKILTNIPRDGFRVTDTQLLNLHFFDNKTNNAYYIYFENNLGDKFRKTISSTSAFIKQVPCGPGNLGVLTTITGAGPLIKDDVEFYDVWSEKSSGVRTSEKLRIGVDGRCVINPHQIYFMDRSGSWSSFAFQLRSFESVETKNESYRKEFGVLGTNGFDFNTTDEGLSIYNSSYNRKIELNTNWMTDEMSVYFEELVTSPYKYILWEGNWFSCKSQQSSIQTERTKNKRLIRKKIEIEFSIQNPVNI